MGLLNRALIGGMLPAQGAAGAFGLLPMLMQQGAGAAPGGRLPGEENASSMNVGRTMQQQPQQAAGWAQRLQGAFADPMMQNNLAMMATGQPPSFEQMMRAGAYRRPRAGGYWNGGQ